MASPFNFCVEIMNKIQCRCKGRVVCSFRRLEYHRKDGLICVLKARGEEKDVQGVASSTYEGIDYETGFYMYLSVGD